MALKPSLDHFRPRTAEEKQKQEVELLAIEKRTKAAAELVSECLSDKKFEKYRAEYEACRKQILDFMIAYSNPDPIQDAYFLRACLGQIKILDIILDSVVKDSKRKVKK